MFFGKKITKKFVTIYLLTKPRSSKHHLKNVFTPLHLFFRLKPSIIMKCIIWPFGMWVVEIKFDHYGDIITKIQRLLFLPLTQMIVTEFLTANIAVALQKKKCIGTFHNILAHTPQCCEAESYAWREKVRKIVLYNYHRLCKV